MTNVHSYRRDNSEKIKAKEKLLLLPGSNQFNTSRLALLYYFLCIRRLTTAWTNVKHSTLNIKRKRLIVKECIPVKSIKLEKSV